MNITFEDFEKIEIKIGKVKSAEKIPDADKLLKLIFDFGDEERQVLSAIALSYPDPSVLIGKEIPVITNLEPRTIRGYESAGMIMALGNEDDVVLLQPDREVPPGTIVK